MLAVPVRGREGFAVLAVAVLLCGTFALRGARADADMIQTVDGKWWPVDEKAPAIGPDDLPGDDVLAAAADVVVDAGYDVVKATGHGGFNKPAGQVKQILASARVTNEKFHTALTDATGAMLGEAAEGFLAAAGELQAFGKQEALWRRVQAYAGAGRPTRPTRRSTTCSPRSRSRSSSRTR